MICTLRLILIVTFFGLFGTTPTTTKEATTTEPPKDAPQWFGDNYCDDENNNEDCGWDGGDCCGDNVNTHYCSDGECLDHGPATIPEQETTSSWNVYEFEGSYSGDLRGYFIAYRGFTKEDLKREDVQMQLDEDIQDPFGKFKIHYIKNSGTDWEWKWELGNGTFATYRGKADGQIISSIGSEYVYCLPWCH